MKTYLYLFLFYLTFTINAANAATVVAVKPTTCNLVKNTSQPFILVIERGENLIQSITTCANAANVASASLTGLGALEQPKIGYFNLDAKKYQFKTFPGIFELTSLIGNIGFKNGERFAHIHITLGNEEYNIIGGHLEEAKVGATAEITFIPLIAPFERKYDKTNGLLLISTQK